MQNDGTGKPKNGFVWTFVAADEHSEQDVAYVFAGGRSGETPKRLIAACHAHLRRYFHESLPTAPIAQEAIDLILGLYRVEHDAKQPKITGTKWHLRLRRQRAGPIRDRLEHRWALHARSDVRGTRHQPVPSRERPEPEHRARVHRIVAGASADARGSDTIDS